MFSVRNFNNTETAGKIEQKTKLSLKKEKKSKIALSKGMSNIDEHIKSAK